MYIAPAQLSLHLLLYLPSRPPSILAVRLSRRSSTELTSSYASTRRTCSRFKARVCSTGHLAMLRTTPSLYTSVGSSSLRLAIVLGTRSKEGCGLLYTTRATSAIIPRLSISAQTQRVTTRAASMQTLLCCSTIASSMEVEPSSSQKSSFSGHLQISTSSSGSVVRQLALAEVRQSRESVQLRPPLFGLSYTRLGV